MKKLYLTLLFVFLAISVLFVPASADTFYDNDGYFTITSQEYIDHPELDYRSSISSPVIENHTIPSDYSIIAKGCYINSSRNYQEVYWIYNRSSAAPFPISISSSNSTSYLYNGSGGGDFIMIIDRVYSDSSVIYWNYITSNSCNISGICSFFVPLSDRSTGDLIKPETWDPLVYFDVVGVSSGVECNIAPRSGSLGTPYDVYLFPSSVPVDGGTVSNIITSSKYITELSASEYTGLVNSGFGDLLDTLQENYNNYYDGGSWYNRGLPQIHFMLNVKILNFLIVLILILIIFLMLIYFLLVVILNYG